MILTVPITGKLISYDPKTKLGVSVVVIRHIEITNPFDMLETWPWAV